MINRVNNILIKDLIAMLANMNLYYEAVDIELDSDKQRVIINPTQATPSENPNKADLKDNDFGDII